MNTLLMSSETKSLGEILAEGYPNRVVAALAAHPEVRSNNQYFGLFVALKSDARNYDEATQRPSPDRDRLERSRQRLLERMGIFINLYELQDFSVPVSELPPPVEMPPEGGSVERILFLCANPSSMGEIQLDKEYTAVSSELQNSSGFRLHIDKATTRESIGEAIARYRPSVIHFAGHGLGQPTDFHKGGIVLEDVQNRSRGDIMSAEALAGLIQSFRPQVPIRLVVLNACETGEHAAVIARSGVRAIGMREEVADGRAIAFATGFYRGLALEPEDVDYAFGIGLAELAARKLAGAVGVPVVV